MKTSVPLTLIITTLLKYIFPTIAIPLFTQNYDQYWQI